MVADDRSISSALCCCEYIDIDDERNHILACCCNCIELDNCFTRLVTCKKVPMRLLVRLMATIQDRMRVPWRGGAKQISVDSILPIIILPILGYIAAQSVWLSIIIFMSLPSCLVYIHYIFMKCHSQTKFFCVWTLMSVFFIVMVFELPVVHMLDIREDEHICFLILTIIMVMCGVKTKHNAEFSHVKNDFKLDKLSEEPDAMCSVCRKRIPARTYHCRICHVCIIKRDQHCAWLDCCIGETNYRWYMATLFSAFAQLMLCSNLILTTVCHPFKVYGDLILLPDDCSDVYFDVVYALTFVTALYCLLIMIFLMVLLGHECWLISLGMTGHEYRNLQRKSCCGLFAVRPYSKGFFRNWLDFWIGSKSSYRYLSTASV